MTSKRPCMRRARRYAGATLTGGLLGLLTLLLTGCAGTSGVALPDGAAMAPPLPAKGNLAHEPTAPPVVGLEQPDLLPDFARPRVVDERNRIFSGFYYRGLRAEDFQASTPPEFARGHEQLLGAVSCVSISPTLVRRGGVRGASDNVPGEASPNIEALGFSAVFDPQCSWRNPDLPEEVLGFVLQHEQVHFALMEITARQLNQRSVELTAMLMQSALAGQSDPDRPLDPIRVPIEAKVAQDLHRHEQFDKDTSTATTAAVQQRWFDRVMLELSLMPEITASGARTQTLRLVADCQAYAARLEQLEATLGGPDIRAHERLAGQHELCTRQIVASVQRLARESPLACRALLRRTLGRQSARGQSLWPQAHWLADALASPPAQLGQWTTLGADDYAYQALFEHLCSERWP